MESRKARIPQKIQDRMTALGIKSISELARRAEMPIMTCHVILTGKKEPGIYTLYPLSKALHMSQESLTETLADSYLEGGSLSLIPSCNIKQSVALDLCFYCNPNLKQAS